MNPSPSRDADVDALPPLRRLATLTHPLATNLMVLASLEATPPLPRTRLGLPLSLLGFFFWIGIGCGSYLGDLGSEEVGSCPLFPSFLGFCYQERFTTLHQCFRDDSKELIMISNAEKCLASLLSLLPLSGCGGFLEEGTRGEWSVTIQCVWWSMLIEVVAALLTAAGRGEWLLDAVVLVALQVTMMPLPGNGAHPIEVKDKSLALPNLKGDNSTSTVDHFAREMLSTDKLNEHIAKSTLYGCAMEELIKTTFNNGNPLPKYNNATKTPEEVKEYREKQMNSPWRDRPIVESLKLFEDMRRGLIDEGKATLRLKQDMQSDNKNMYDLIAYHIKFTPHPHAGDKWCIYPSYDFSHRIVDSLQNVTHSLNRLVTKKWEDGWDDPCLMILAVLRRCGVSSTAINSFIRGIEITRRYAFPIKCTEVIYGNNDTDLEIHAEYDPSKKTKPKGVLHWVAQPSPGVEPLKVEVRLFEKLFLSENPGELEDWLADLNPHSKVVIPEAYAVPSLASAVAGDKFQFERMGYFAVDPNSTQGKLVFNRTIPMRDSYSKVGNK
ncbi:hypothetical protein Cni_G02297 [Canna indica]|uniref:glutamine--tRNA ligase n=1 Tax=Canna indica TaxID=4628 RepID=A0AAQ3JPV0_9LILI|nr:hypothetical protein Cni_G02297 [Canna indica]